MSEFLDPNSILIPESRQRATLGDVSDIQASIARNGLINAIVVRQGPDGSVVIVAGARRTQACRNLGKNLEIGRDVRFWEDLDPTEAEVLELEENLKRQDLPWRDQVRAIAKLHQRYSERNEGWTQLKTAHALSLEDSWISMVLTVHRAMQAGHLTNASDINNAYNIAQRIAERKAEAIVNEIVAGGKQVWQPTLPVFSEQLQESEWAKRQSESGLDTQSSDPIAHTMTPPAAPTASFQPVLCANFIEWAQAYTGPKFNLLHCDFPYGIVMASSQREGSQGWTGWQSHDDEVYDNDPQIYFKLLNALTGSLDRILSHNAHVLFWFTMKFYNETKRQLEQAGLLVQPYPFVWDKAPTGMSGDARLFPKITYETCFIASRGQRPLAKYGFLTYKGPIPTTRQHPSQKSEAMYKALLGMFVDETTTLLDPTCGHGGALRTADELGAASVLGIEFDPNYAKAANDATVRARRMREAAR